ncbi:uncharacterized protein LOC131199783 [Ahaetulla prasina]|uniref:uncharacterized protein LOC131199783 n=1 Tax=Ahaetulla prasina TaxID=499056 RepID=UPI00264974BD|nr:uncharacterized protein LOC131199783 [Ahaetulla prasina]
MLTNQDCNRNTEVGDRKNVMEGQLPAEPGEASGGISADTFNPELEDCRARWIEQLKLEEKGWKPDTEELPSGVTKRKKKGKERLSEAEQEIRDKLQLEEALRLFREVKERQAARQRYESPIRSSRWEGEEEEEITKGPDGGVSQGGEISEGPELENPFPEAAELGRERMPPADQARLRRGRKKPKIPPISEKFDGNAKELELFLAIVNDHMIDWGEDYWSQAAQVRAVTHNLTGRAAAWLVSLYTNHSPLLQNYEHFITALRRRFEDPLAEQKAKGRMKTIRQGRRPVADYSQEFSDLVPLMRGWSEVTLVDIYKDGLNGDLYELCRARASPTTLYGWYTLAAEMEIELVKDRGRRLRTGGLYPAHSPGGAYRDVPRSEGGRQRSTACYRCGKEGHRAADCRVKLVPSTTSGGEKEPVKPAAKARKPAKVGEGVAKKGTPIKEDCEASTDTDDSKTTSESDEDLLVSWTRGPLDIPVNLHVPSSGNKGEMLALLDSGCTRCMISPELVEKMELKLRTLSKPIAFAQLDGSVAGGGPAHFVTEPIEMIIGDHREILNFIVAPGMDQPLLLGLSWLRKWNPHINWRTGVLRFRSRTLKREKGEPKERSTVAMFQDTLGAMVERIDREERIPKEYWDLREVFSEKASDVLPPHRPIDCAIDILPGVKLPKPKAYPMTQKELEELRKFIDKNLERGFIQLARPRVAAPVMFREKKDGSFRLIVDYWNLNAVCAENIYPMPLMKDMLAHLAKGKFFTKLDLREAYYRVRIKEGDEWKTAFNCPLGCFQFRVLPFGLQGAPAVFMQLINEILHQHLFKGVLVYLDDILIYTETMEEHIKLVRAVLKKLLSAELYCKLSKCDFHQTKIDYLGYRISADGLEMDPGKVKAVLEWAPPRTRKQLQSFLGFANFYRQFIPSFAQIALPITNLLKTKGDTKPKPSLPLEWTMECQAAFEKLKRLFAAEPILKHPDMDVPFVIQADASDVAVGAVLLQNNVDGKLQPCAFTSRKLTETERRWAIWEKEAFAVHWALRTWRQFLEGSNHPFEVWTDHKNLEALKTPRKLSPKQARWAQYFNRFNFTLHYIPGGKNFLADALSRLPQYNCTRSDVVQPILPVQQLAAPAITRSHSKAKPSFPDELTKSFKEALNSDDWYLAHSHECTLCDGLAWIGMKLYVPLSLRETILQRCHDAKMAGHFGFVKTLHLLKRQFWWPSLKKDIQAYVASCPVCASSKRPPGKPPGLLQTVARPGTP